MKREVLWEQLTSAGCAGDLPEPVVSNPWYVKLMLAFSGWLASLFLFAFSVPPYPALLDEPSFCLMLGLGLNAGTFALLRKQPSDFVEHIGLAVSIAGQGLVAFGAAQSLDIGHASPGCSRRCMKPLFLGDAEQYSPGVFESAGAGCAGRCHGADPPDRVL